jgi:hypothetical protein
METLSRRLITRAHQAEPIMTCATSVQDAVIHHGHARVVCTPATWSGRLPFGAVTNMSNARHEPKA